MCFIDTNEPITKDVYLLLHMFVIQIFFICHFLFHSLLSHNLPRADTATAKTVLSRFSFKLHYFNNVSVFEVYVASVTHRLSALYLSHKKKQRKTKNSHIKHPFLAHDTHGL